MHLSVHYLHQIDNDYVDRLRSQLEDGIALTHGKELPARPDYHILVAGRLEEKHIEASPNLRSVIIPWAGLPVKTREVLLGHPEISVHNQHYNAVMVAESAVTLMLTAARGLIPVDRAMRHHDWTVRYNPHRSVLLHGKTALIFGYGAIGHRIAAACRGLGLNVIGVKRSVTFDRDEWAEIHPWSALPDLLPRADVLFISSPLTPETADLIGSSELALLPDRATIVNIARGPIINESALFEELRSGRIQAGLDVWYNYPDSTEARSHTPPSRYPFHELDTVVMSPHMAEHALETESQQIAELAEMLNAAARGDALPNPVEPERGY